MNNFGSFGNIDPEGMQAIKEALSRRGMGDSMPALNTQSGASPTPSPLPEQPSGDLSQPTQPAMPAATPAVSQGNPEARLIVSALKERLKSISEVEMGVMPTMV